MNRKDKIELLKSVVKVEAPPFLWTRIQAKIKAVEAERLPAAWGWAGSLALTLLLLLNLVAISNPEKNAPATPLVEQLHMNQTNQFYADQN